MEAQGLEPVMTILTKQLNEAFMCKVIYYLILERKESKIWFDPSPLIVLTFCAGKAKHGDEGFECVSPNCR